MNRTIKLVMEESKDIKIYVDNELELTIIKTSRELKANEIYSLFKFSPGVKYIVLKENVKELDTPVIDELEKIFIDISDKLNELPSLSEEMNKEDNLINIEEIE